MNDINILNIVLGSILLIGFGIRYLLPEQNKLSAIIGKRTPLVFMFVVMYVGLVFASIGKLTYANIFISSLAYGLLYICLNFTLSRMYRNR